MLPIQIKKYIIYRYLITFFLCSFSFFISHAQKKGNRYYIKGKIDHYSNTMIYIGKDSLRTNNDGSFSYKSIDSIQHIKVIFISFIHTNPTYKVSTICFVQPAQLTTIIGDVDSINTIQLGGDVIMNKELNIFNRQLLPINNAISTADELFHKGGSFHTIDSLQMVYNSMVIEYIKQEPKQMLSAYLIISMIPYLDLTQLTQLFEQLSNKVKASPYGNSIQNTIQHLTNSALGKRAIDLNNYTDKDGNSIHINQYKGKYLILDFWGSWCHWCRVSHPELIKLYNQYKNDGLNIVGIACYDKKKPWLEAIATDQLPWRQVLCHSDNDIAKDYAITSFPTKILINPQGIIIDRITGSDEAPLIAKLKELFKL